MKDEISLQNVKFDMRAIAKELGVSIVIAHYVVQRALFNRGVKWATGRNKVVTMGNMNYLYIDNKGEMRHSSCDYPLFKSLSIKPQYSFYVKEEEEKPETIEFNGKQYNKDDVTKALALLSPIN